MQDAGRSECRIAGGKPLGFLADLHYPAACQDEIKLILSGMGVSCMFLARFERVQTREEKFSARYCALRHFVWRKRGEAGDILHEHTG